MNRRDLFKMIPVIAVLPLLFEERRYSQVFYIRKPPRFASDEELRMVSGKFERPILTINRIPEFWKRRIILEQKEGLRN